MHHGSEPQNLPDANADMKKCLESKATYKYAYSEFLTTRIYLILCCCCKKQAWLRQRAKRLQRHELAQKKLAKETDFFQFLKTLRIAQFMAKITLRKYQRGLVPYFKKYQLTALDGDDYLSLLDT